SLVFGFDRDLGVMTLTTEKAWHPVPPLMSVKYETASNTIQTIEVAPPPRRLIKAMSNGKPFTIHIDFGAKLSQLRERAWGNAGLAAEEADAGVIDETGFARQVSKVVTSDAKVLASPVSPNQNNGAIDAASTSNVVFVPYDDKRWPDQDLDGALGQNFFR